VERLRRGARAVESARLESAWAPKVSRGFESHPLRFSSDAECSLCLCRRGPQETASTTEVMVVLGGEVAVPCNPQAARAGLNSLLRLCQAELSPTEGTEDWVLCNGVL
jgi:hypothetical protein